MTDVQSENRNWGCNCNINSDWNTVANNIGSMFMNNNMSNCEDNEMTRERMLNKIKCLHFVITELGLYLDTHPDDERALCLHRKYAKELRELEDKYQKVYGPLTINFPCNKWRWIEEPWPWERGGF